MNVLLDRIRATGIEVNVYGSSVDIKIFSWQNLKRTIGCIILFEKISFFDEDGLIVLRQKLRMGTLVVIFISSVFLYFPLLVLFNRSLVMPGLQPLIFFFIFSIMLLGHVVLLRNRLMKNIDSENVSLKEKEGDSV